MSPFSFEAALSPASSMLQSDGSRWKNKGHLISFGRMRLQPKRPPPLSISTSGENTLRTLSSMHRIGQKILPSFGTWVSRSTTTMNPPLRMFLLATHPLSMGGHSWKGRSEDGMALIAVQCCKVQCTMDQHLQMIGPPTANPSVKSSSTASPVISLRLPSSRQQTTRCLR